MVSYYQAITDSDLGYRGNTTTFVTTQNKPKLAGNGLQHRTSQLVFNESVLNPEYRLQALVA